MNGKIIFTGLLLILFSCRKEKDSNAPVISLSAPYNFSSFALPSLIPCVAEIKDDKQIEQVQIQVMDPGGRVVASEIFAPGGKLYTLSHHFYLDDPFLVSGTYYVKISASDGINQSSRYAEIQIQEIPLAVEKIVLISKNGPADLLQEINGNALAPLYSFSESVIACDLSSSEKSLAFAQQSGDALVISMNNLLPSYSIPWFNSGTAPYFRHLHYDNSGRRLWSAHGDGSLRAYNAAGHTVAALSVQNAYIAGAGAEINSSYLCQIQHPVTQQKNLALYSISSGMLMQSQTVTWTLLRAFPLPNDNMMLFGNDGNQAVVHQYELNSNLISSPLSLPAGRLHAVCAIDENNWLLAHSDGLFQLQYGSSGLFAISNLTGQDLAFDPVGNFIYLASGNQLMQLSYPDASLVNSFTTTDSLKMVRILFNK